MKFSVEQHSDKVYEPGTNALRFCGFSWEFEDGLADCKSAYCMETAWRHAGAACFHIETHYQGQCERKFPQPSLSMRARLVRRARLF